MTTHHLFRFAFGKVEVKLKTNQCQIQCLKFDYKMADSLLSVDWKTYPTFLQNNYKNLYQSRSFSDVTLVSGDLHCVQAHRNILAGSSPVLEKLISETGTNSVLYLRGISKENLESILQFLYLGETRIQIGSFYQFVEICKDLEIADWKNTETINQEISEELSDLQEKTLITGEPSIRNTKTVAGETQNMFSTSKSHTQVSATVKKEKLIRAPESLSGRVKKSVTLKKTENQANNPIDVEETSNYNCGVCFENFGEQIVYLKHMATGHKFIKS